MKKCPYIVAIVCIGCLLSFNAYSEGQASWAVDVDISAEHDTNIGRAWLSVDTVEDSSASTEVSVAYDVVISDLLAVSVGAVVGGKAYKDIDKLNSIHYGGFSSLRFQTRHGYDAPMYQFSVTVKDENVQVDQRDNLTTTLQAFVNRRLTDRISGVMGIEYRDSESDGVAFDVERTRFFLSGDYDISQSISMYSSYSYSQGDAFSSAQRVYANGFVSSYVLRLINISTAIELDDAFNHHFKGTWLAYRFDASMHSFKLGANYGINGSTSVDASAMYVDVEADEDSGISYDTTIYTLSLLKRF